MSRIASAAERILMDNMPEVVKLLVEARREQAEHRIKMALQSASGYGFGMIECFNSKQMPLYVLVSFVAEKLSETGINIRKSRLRKILLESCLTNFILGVAAEQLNMAMVDSLRQKGFRAEDFGKAIVVRKAPLNIKLRGVSFAVAY